MKETQDANLTPRTALKSQHLSSSLELPAIKAVPAIQIAWWARIRVGKIHPDEVHINFPSRPPAETWVRPPEEAALRHAAGIFGDIARIVRPEEELFDMACCGEVTEAILSIIARHPMREQELRSMLERWDAEQVEAALNKLAADGQTKVVERYGSRFWSVSEARYAKI